MPSLRRRNRVLLGSVCACAIFAFGASSANAMNQRKVPEKAAEHASKEPFGDVPKGPVEIVVSIDQQKLHLYSNGQHVADTSVATGVPSLPTPLGFFDVIQKQVFHRSNIYSGAPMPFMQRITWSGVALHEGENIGHRASHGCIRMPHDFAVRLYQFTKLGARVIVADAELKPSEIADPHLFVYKVAPPPNSPVPPVAAAVPAKQQPANDGDKKTDTAETPKPATPVAAQLNETSSPAVAAEPVKAAQPGDDAKASAVEAPKADSPAGAPANETVSPVVASDAAKSAVSSDDAKPSDTAGASKAEFSKAESPETAASKTKASDNNSPKVETSESEAPKPDAPFGEPPVPSAASNAATPPQSNDSAKANDTPQAPQPMPVVAQHMEQAAAVAPRPVTNKVAEHLVSENLRGTDANPTLVVASSSEAVPLPSAKPAAAVAPAVEKKTPISIFVSRKTQRIYVRQNFAPLFDAAITIDHPEQPLGSHVFTALGYLPDGTTFRWDVVSAPGVPPKAKPVEVKDRYGRVVRREQAAEKQSGPLPPPQTPAEALARLEIQQDVVDRISAMMVPGSSLIVSDQGLGEETGEGTDFIVVSR
jgi:L,D-transpeptidase catalytic domain